MSIDWVDRPLLRRFTARPLTPPCGPPYKIGYNERTMVRCSQAGQDDVLLGHMRNISILKPLKNNKLTNRQDILGVRGRLNIMMSSWQYANFNCKIWSQARHIITMGIMGIPVTRKTVFVLYLLTGTNDALCRFLCEIWNWNYDVWLANFIEKCTAWLVENQP